MNDIRRIRVFVSSTFRDMVEDRNELMTQTWPELRRFCRERQVELVEVDLRWGIAEEQSTRKETLKLCLDEIHACRPYFVGLLGERYGWTPGADAFTADLQEEQQWLHGLAGKSVTELEILHGVLNNPAMAGRSFFYFRDPTYGQARGADYLSEDTEAANKQVALKETIRRASVEQHIPLRENYPDPRALAELVLKDLKDAIEAQFPIEEVPDWLVREARDHEAFAEIRRRTYISRPDYFARLDHHAAGDGGPLVLLGESGSGKSALVANWLEYWHGEHPKDFLYQHYIGGTPDSADHWRLMARLIAEIKRWTHDSDSLPRSHDEMLRDFSVWLAKARSKAEHDGVRCILVFDALNQLEDNDHARTLGWLPTDQLTGKLRLIVSTLPGETMDAVSQRGWKSLSVEPLSPGERQRMIGHYLARFGKKLDGTRLDRLAAAPAAANPLYLKILLDELRVTGTHDRLDERLNEYLSAQDIPALLKQVLARYRRDYERDRPGLVSDSLGLIWAARRGLTEPELLRLLKPADLPQLPLATWSPLRASLDESLVDHGGILNFAHNFLREAVRQAYLSTENQQQDAYHTLSLYFDDQAVGFRRIDELPWLLERQKDWAKQRDFLVDSESFTALFGDDQLKWELLAYWVAIGSHFDPRAEYRAAVEMYALDHSAKGKASFQHSIGEFFLLRGEDASAVEFFDPAFNSRTVLLGEEDAATLATGNRLALAQEHLGHYGEAESLYRKLLAICEKLFGSDHPNTLQAVHDLGGFLGVKDHSADAIPLLERALAGREKRLGITADPTLSTRLNLGMAYFNAKDPRTEKFYLELLALAENVRGKDSAMVQEVILSLAVLFVRERRFREAEPLFRRAAEIAELRFGPLHPKTIRNVINVGNCLVEQDKKAEGGKFWMDGYQRMQKSTGNLLILPESQIRTNLITLLMQTEDFKRAAPLAIDDLHAISCLAEHMDDPRYYIVDPSRQPGPDPLDSTNCALDISSHLMDKNDDLAEAVLLACLPVLKIIYGERGPQVGLACNSLGILMKRKGALAGAEDYYRRALKAFAGTEKEEAAQASQRNLLWVQRARLESQTPHPIKRGELRLAKKIKAHDGAILALAYSAQRQTLISGGQDSQLKLWSTESMQMFHRLRGHEAPVSGLSLGRDGQFAVSGSWDQTIRIWNLTELAKRPLIQACPSDICGVAASPHGELRIVFALEDGQIGLWNDPENEPAKAIGRHQNTATTIAISDDGKYAVSGSQDQMVKFWDLASAGSFSLPGHRVQITSKCVNHTGSMGISGSEDGAIIVWDLENCEMRRILKGHTQIIGALAISSDDRWIVSGSWDKTICIWDTGSGECAATFAIGEQVWSLAASPTFDSIYVGDKAGIIHLLQFTSTSESASN